MSTSETLLAWHFVPADRKLRYSGEPLKVGRTYTCDGTLDLCENGLHACENLIDTLEYAPGPILCRVQLSGEILRVDGENKVCARKRKVLWAVDADRLLHRFACMVAAHALRRAKVTDKRCWEAIKVKRLWLAGKATDAELAAARDAAWAAAWDAARDAAWAAARDAARDAARAAAWAAAWAAARDAARDAAWDAAWAAARDLQARLLNRLVAAEAKKHGHKI